MLREMKILSVLMLVALVCVIQVSGKKKELPPPPECEMEIYPPSECNPCCLKAGKGPGEVMVEETPATRIGGGPKWQTICVCEANLNRYDQDNLI